MQACEILSKHPQIADPLKKDKFGKVAADYADSTRDKRLTLLVQSNFSDPFLAYLLRISNT